MNFFKKKALPHPYYHLVEHGDFEKRYATLETRLGMKPSAWRRDRFFTLYGLVTMTKGVEGAVAECGVFKGMSSAIMLEQLRAEKFDET